MKRYNRDHHIGHRCAGEWLTVIVMRSFFKYCAENITYKVPEQDLSYDMSRMPTMPKSGFVITEVQKLKDSVEDLERYEQSQTVVKS
jgi:fatty-acid peroxygenase